MMKKIVLLTVVLTAVACLSFADTSPGLSVIGWGRGFFIPAMSAGSNLQTTDIASWGSPGPRVSFTVEGMSPEAGFQIDIDVDGNTIIPGDQQKIWVKPIPMLQLTAGYFYDDTLRGSASYGAWNWVRYEGMANGDDYVFTRVCAQNTDDVRTNFVAGLTPVDGMYIFGSLNGILGMNADLMNSFMLGQYGAGYTFPGIGSLRAQYMGITTQYGLLNAAFRLTAIQNLMIDLGCYIPAVPNDAGYNANIPLFLTYTMDPAIIYINGRVQIPTTGDAGYEAGLGVDVTVEKTNKIGITGDVRYQNKALTTMVGGPTYDNGTISFLLGISKTFNNGIVGIGFEGTTGNFVNTLSKTDISTFAWEVPIKLQYSF